MSVPTSYASLSTSASETRYTSTHLFGTAIAYAYALSGTGLEYGRGVAYGTRRCMVLPTRVVLPEGVLRHCTAVPGG
eukprot:3096691-Rhodomonas_salina.1